MDVKLPDGTVIQGVPDGTTKEQLLGKLQKNGYDVSKIMSADPTEGMSGMEKFAAGVGKSLVDVARGAGQIVGLTPQSNIDESRRLDSPLMKSGPGFAGNLAGNIGIGVSTAAIPGANTLTGATLTGAGLGALTPTATGESRGSNMLAGGALGLGGQLAANALRPVRPMLNPEQTRLAGVAAKEGIPLTAADLTGSRPLKVIDSVMDNLPLTAGPQEAIRQGKQEAFNRAVLRRAGMDEPLATATDLATRKAALGKVFEDISSRNSVTFNNQVVTDIANVASQANKRLIPDQAKAFQGVIDDLLNQVGQNGQLSGSQYQAFRTELGKLGKGADRESLFYRDLKKVLDNAFNSQISGADAAAWKQASGQYGNLKTILNATGGGGVAKTAGNIPPAQLDSALGQAVGREGKALGRGELNDLTRVGLQFVRDGIPDSGTAQRLAYQTALTGGLGGAGYLASGGDVSTAGMLAGAGLLSPRLIQQLINSPAGRAYLSKGILSVSPATQGVLSGGVRGGVLSLPQFQGQQ